MKTVSADKTYIDYTGCNFGVRVWREKCQSIARDSSSSEWITREATQRIPVYEETLYLPLRGRGPITALAREVARYEGDERDPELRRVLRGWRSFDDAVSTL